MAGFTYKSYNFVDKDPIIDEIRTIYEDSGANYHWIHENSNVSTTTLNNWFSGKTKTPRAATVNAVLRCLGYKLGVVEMGQRVIINPPLDQPKPRSNIRHIVQMSKYKKSKKSHRG